MKPKFSIVMANYNRGAFIEQAIASVLKQTFQDWELVIVDDCSTDNSLSIIGKYEADRRIKLIRHERNFGYTAALKTGISNISSDLFGILDSDDALAPEAVETMYAGHIEYPDAGLIYSQFMYCDENLKPTQTGYCKQIPSNKTNLDSDAVSHFKTFKLKCYNQTEGYAEEILHAQDKDISYKIEEVSQLKFIDKVLYYYRVQPNSLQRGTNYRGFEYVMKAKINALQRRNEKNATLQKDALHNFATALDKFYKEDFTSAEAEMDKYRKSIKYDLFPKFDNRKMENPLVSVIVVAYQTNELLLNCMQSLLTQTENKFEIIVVDNGGNDDVLKQLLALPILYIKCPMNFVLSEGRNIGAHFAKADIIASLDDDAVVPDNYVESIVKAFNTHDIYALRGKVIPKNPGKFPRRIGVYDLGEIPIPATIVAEGNSAYVKKIYRGMHGMNPLLFGGEGLELSFLILSRYGENRAIYWPQTVIFHDPADSVKQEIKKERYQRNFKYLEGKYPNIWEYHNKLMEFAKDDESKKKGQALLRMKNPDFLQNQNAGNGRLTWDTIKKLQKIRLYAGDIPEMKEYEGLVGLSMTKNDECHILHDITKPFPLPDNSVDTFQAEDVLEHIPYDQLIPVINEIFRILKPNGLFRLSLPDYGCDILQSRSIKDPSGNIVFDPGGGGTFLNPGHVWFPRIDTVKSLLEQTKFAKHGKIEYLHYYNMDRSFTMKPIDYSKGHIHRTSDFDSRVQNPKRPMSLVVDLVKGSNLSCDDHIPFDEGSASLSKIETNAVENFPKLSFITIVLNGMPFIEFAIKAIYDIAYEIIIVEGAVEKCMFAANADGSSKDGTVEFIKTFPDPEQKIKLIQGKWPDKVDMQNKALEIIMGDYVWLVDSDEIYKKKDLIKIRELIKNDPSISQINFIPDNFWKGFDYLFVSPKFFEKGTHYRRVFKFFKGARFITHRPPTMVYPGSNITTEQMHLIDGHQTRGQDIIIFHYSYVLKDQVKQKIDLYNGYGWGKNWGVDLNDWYNECFLKWTPENKEKIEKQYPVWTGDKNSYTVKFEGTHPSVMLDYIAEFKKGSTKKKLHKNVKVAGDFDHGQGLTKIGTESKFANNIKSIISKIKPKKIIETGTFLGTGTTRIIAEALRENNLPKSKFYSIEVNPDNYNQARANLKEAGLLEFVKVLNGVSIPRNMLPTIEEIEDRCVRNIEFDNIFVDHKEHERALLYHRETNFDNVPDDLLGKYLKEFDYRPEFVLLDSGGHIGNIEFNYLISQLKGECYIALDDIYHIKHRKSFSQIQNDSRFTVIVSSDEKFGFCIAKFTPTEETSERLVKNILWIRTDSIGDNVLAASMLPHIREKYKNAKITILCQQHIAELYEACPFVDGIVTFDKDKAYKDSSYRNSILLKLRSLNPHIALNSVFSREPITDILTVESGTRERIAFNGDLANGGMTQEIRDRNNQSYTSLIESSEEWKPELERHSDFLKAIGIEVSSLKPTIWTTPEDEQFADNFFRDNNLRTEQTIALFAGAQDQERLYRLYGDALSHICEDRQFTIIAFGTEQDRTINQQNLDAINVNSINLSGKTTLRQTAALIKRCRLAVGAETGIAHVACAVGTPNVILLGGGFLGRFMPYSPLTTVVCLPLECYGCYWRCRYQRVHCVRDILPEVFAEAIHQTLNKTSQTPRVFVQGKSLWSPGPREPQWKWFNKYLNLKSVEIIAVGEIPDVEEVSPGLTETVKTGIQNATAVATINHSNATFDVSIILATKDRAQALDEMLSSVKDAAGALTYEIIVIDGNSDDNTSEILRKHGVTLVLQEDEEMGKGKHSWPQLYNFGFSKAKGKWGMYASDDIVFEKNCLANAVALLDKHHTDVAGGIFFYKDAYPENPEWSDFGLCFTVGQHLLMNYGLVRMDFFREVQGIDDHYKFYQADADLSLKAAASGRYFIPLPESFLIHSHKLKSKNQMNQQYGKEDTELLLQKWRGSLPVDMPFPYRLMYNEQFKLAYSLPQYLPQLCLGLREFWHGISWFQKNQYEKAAEKFVEAASSCRHWIVLWYLAKAFIESGNIQEGKHAVGLVVQCAPDFHEAKELLAQLDGQATLSENAYKTVPRTVGEQPAARGHTKKKLVIQIKYGGLGDHLFFSHLPRIAKETEGYEKVYISNFSEFRHPDYKRLIWELNPYVDGFCDEPGFYPDFEEVESGMNVLDKIMILQGIDDGKRFHEPEMYYKPEILPELQNKIVYDPNFISYVGELSSESVESYFSEHNIFVDYQMKLRDKHYPVRNSKHSLESVSLEHFCSILVSCKNLYCLASGTATLASALGKPATVFYGVGQKPMFHHSALHRYELLHSQPSAALIEISKILGQSAPVPLLNQIHNFNQLNRDRWVQEKANTVPSGSRVLDVGAGTCPYRPLFAHCKYKAHDFKKYTGEKLGGRTEYGTIDYESDITDIPVPDSSFDVILCTEVLEHVAEPFKAVQEMVRILKPGGRLFLTAPLGSGLHQLPYHFYGGFTPEWYKYAAKKFNLHLMEIMPNGGFFKLLSQECARVAWTFEKHKHFHGDNAEFIYQLFNDLLPRYLFALDGKCFIDQFTVGYHIEAIKLPSGVNISDEKRLSESLKKDFKDVEALLRLAEIEIMRSNQKKARNLLIAAMAIDPLNSTAKALMEKLG